MPFNDSTTPARATLILGTAGHIDHGKSTLVKALTGTDPDRLPEERRRGMTIELGFAHLDVTDGTTSFRFGIVDVPGHEKFVRTMVSGATGIDVAILVVAADDGWMPQTQEHADILDLLGVERGIVAITKSDAVPAERLVAVLAEIKERASKSIIASWPVLETSAKANSGIDALRSALARIAMTLHQRHVSSVFRLAVDRVFTVHGRGTVATGSVLSGQVSPGDELEILPAAVVCKVREVQTHDKMVAAAASGQRAALNLTGIDRDSIERGMDLVTPGYLAASRYVDARVRLLSTVDAPLKSHRRVRVLIGTTEAMATLVVIGADAIRPGDDAFVQLRVHRPIVAGFRQRFILRDETAARTMGGGTVIRPQARRVRAMLAETIQSFERAASEDAHIRLADAIRESGFNAATDLQLAGRIGVEPHKISSLLEALASEHALAEIKNLRVHRDTLSTMLDRSATMLKRYHASRPNEPGMQRDKFIGWIAARSAPDLGKPLLVELESRGTLVARGPYLAHQEFSPAMSIEDELAMNEVFAEIEAAGFDPPEWQKLRAICSLSRQRAKSLSDIAKTDPRLVSFALGYFIATSAMERFRAIVADLGAKGRRFRLADVRDRSGQSRRVVQPLLEHLDRTGFTKRVGDERILR